MGIAFADLVEGHPLAQMVSIKPSGVASYSTKAIVRRGAEESTLDDGGLLADWQARVPIDLVVGDEARLTLEDGSVLEVFEVREQPDLGSKLLALTEPEE